jgi:hypothetical protein
MTSSSTITMLHSRPSSSEAFQSPPQQSPRLGQAPRSMYNGSNNTAYKNSPSPVQPYAFQSTPHLRQESRTISAPSADQNLLSVQRAGHAQSASTSTASSSDASSAKDDSVIGTQAESSINFSSSVPDLTLNNFDQPAKPSPDRYRRTARRTNSNNSVPKTAPTGAASSPTTTFASVLSPPSPTIERTASHDDAAVPKSGNGELAKRYRRRSLNTIEILPNGDAQRPSSSHGANAAPAANTIRSVGTSETTQRSNSTSEGSSLKANETPSSQKTVNVPPRGASDPAKRLATPSPLSRQADDAQPSAAVPTAPRHRSYASVTRGINTPPSAAAQHLAAVSDRDLNKGMKSRLRRAFSFGSAQELRRAEVSAGTPPLQVDGQQPPRPDDELDPEQLEIARRQEAAGIGANIYSGQGGFTGSTDNISISSTASSASMMLRKMGKGAKKSARSIKGLFRPKSVIGVPAADGPVNQQRGSPLQPSMAQVSMVTVEAERQKVNVNAELDEKNGGATGFPKLERNSVDAVQNASARPSAEGSDSFTRRSIVGSDKDRAEVLAAVKKGILKRSGTSPTNSPDIRPNDGVPHILDSPASSMPSTPKEGSIRSASLRDTTNADYFSQPRVASMTNTRSMPATPTGGKGITFSPRIQFHDAWSASDYDRRGDIATCNRLTPILAQQIKEELNTFKMVCTCSTRILKTQILIFCNRRWRSTNRASLTRTSFNDATSHHPQPQFRPRLTAQRGYERRGSTPLPLLLTHGMRYLPLRFQQNPIGVYVAEDPRLHNHFCSSESGSESKERQEGGHQVLFHYIGLDCPSCRYCSQKLS